jgi:hypothetical protein
MPSVLFPDDRDLTNDELSLLADAYEIACNELQDEFGFSADGLAHVIGPMTRSLMTAYRGGMRSAELLAAYSALTAVNRCEVDRLQ